jgi:type II secretory pathway component PulF
MPRFSYIAIDHNRKSVKGTLTAESCYAARKHLRAKGVHATEIKELAVDKNKTSLKSLFGKSKKKQVVEFTSQLSTMLNSGIKLTESLGVLIQQVSDPQLKNAVTDIRDRVVNGESFAETLGEYSDYFDVIYISMVRVGEVTGTLPASLASIAAFMTKRQRLDSKMATAMIYPEILLVACIGAIIFLTIKVIPVVAEQITATGEKLPFVTVAMLAISDVMTSYWAFAIAFAVVATIWSVRRFVATPKGAFVKDKIMLSLPVFGPLIKQQIVARFASTLSTLLESGLSMADSLKVVAEVTGNTIMNKAVNQARERIMSGSDIATPLRDSGVIDPTIAHMVVVGERSGELEQMLKNIAENLEANSDVVIERLSAAIEPVIVVFMAILIGIIAYATLVPIIRYSAGQF